MQIIMVTSRVNHENKEVQLQIQYETILFFVTEAPTQPYTICWLSVRKPVSTQ